MKLRYSGGTKHYPYGRRRVRVVRARAQPLPPGSRVDIEGQTRESVIDLRVFDAPQGDVTRVFWRADGKEHYGSWPANEVQVVRNEAADGPAAGVLAYWKRVAEGLPTGDPIRRPYRDMGFVHPDSALARFIAGGPIGHVPRPIPAIFPFRSNLSQREAVARALGRTVSVIEGPPGTGKTETILNIIASLVASRAGTVGIISANNAAVENVHEKLVEVGLGHIIAALGRREKVTAFLDGQPLRHVQLRDLGPAPAAPAPQALAQVAERLERAQHDERRRAEVRSALDELLTELRHFDAHMEGHAVPELDGLPLLRRSAEHILDFLIETDPELHVSRPKLWGRIRRYFRYGSLRGLDPGDTDVVLRLQRTFYERRAADLRRELDLIEARVRDDDLDLLVSEHRALSTQTLNAALAQRYQGIRTTVYRHDDLRTGGAFRRFTDDYPVILSTCHSLRANLPDGYLLDYLIIDEASQVDLLAGSLALASCRNVVVVGDRRQLPHISKNVADDLVAPAPAFDFTRQNILVALGERHGDELPATLLREHYRCDPAIIGFCNKSFYGGDLIPYTRPGAGQPMVVVRTVAGTHMRQHHDSGRFNQREVDVIRSEVIPDLCGDVAPQDIGITTPYRGQVNRLQDALIAEIEADTVHKYQGRQKPVIILTTVLDEGRFGRMGLRFVDDPHLINVAVSRAARRFILVTNNDLMPKSRHIRDLIEYIRYQNPGEEITDSDVVSVFDLLYQAYDRRLRPLARQLRNELTYRSEDIIWTLLHEILAEEQYRHLRVAPQVLVRNLLPDLTRLTPRQTDFVQHRASVDFVVYNRVTNGPVLAIEVDGFAYHENKPEQLERDALKDEIFAEHSLRLLRLPTTGSDEEERIRRALDDL